MKGPFLVDPGMDRFRNKIYFLRKPSFWKIHLICREPCSSPTADSGRGLGEMTGGAFKLLGNFFYLIFVIIRLVGRAQYYRPDGTVEVEVFESRAGTR